MKKAINLNNEEVEFNLSEKIDKRWEEIEFKYTREGGLEVVRILW